LAELSQSLTVQCGVPGGYRTISRRTGLGRSRRDALPGGDREDLTSAVGAAGADTIAALVTERYLDFEPVHRALADTFRPAAGTG
jgi:hypothetical protein